jgi:trimethylamine monooxygenase
LQAADIMTYRDKNFVSKFTGTRAPLYHTTFMKAFDDSLESFVIFDKSS